MKILKHLDSAIKLYLNTFCDNIDDYIEINTACDDYNFVTKKGYMCTLLEIKGSLIENDDYQESREVTDIISSKIGSFFNTSNHFLQIVYLRSESGAEEIYDEVVKASYERSKKLNLDTDELFKSQKDTFVKKIVNEKVLVAAWTRTKDLSSLEYTKSSIEIASSENEIGDLRKSPQSLTNFHKKVVSQHKNYVSNINKVFNSQNVVTQILTREKSAQAMRRAVDPNIEGDIDVIFPDSDYFGKGYEKAFGKDFDIKDGLWPSLSEQLLPENTTDNDITNNVAKIGDTLFTTFEVVSPPRTLVTFNDLTDELADDIPCQISFFIDSAVSFNFFWKSALSKIPFPSSNIRLSQAISATNKLKLIKEPTVEYKISVSTWSKDFEKLIEQKTSLKSALTRWGGATVKEYEGNPTKAYIYSGAGFNDKIFGGTVFAPLAGVMPQLPLSRRINVWGSSFLSFMAKGGKLFPYSPTSSSMQKYWNIGILADMGSGKSVLTQAIALSHMLASNDKGALPMVGYLDNGFSAEGVISALRYLSDGDNRHRYMHHTLINTSEVTFNIHDTQLGCRRPDVDQMKFITNFYANILTPAGESKPHADVVPLINQAIKDAYIYLSDHNQPKEYTEGVYPELDKKLKELNSNISSGDISWWELVDILFDKKLYLLASKVQRQAVPTIFDIIKQLNISKTINNEYTNVMVSDKESIVQYVSRMLTQAIEAYPVITKPTTLDVEHANFIVVDLDRVAKGESSEELKKAAVFYNLGRFIVSRNFFIAKELLEVCPDKYIEYHTKRVARAISVPKLLVYDEFHRVGWLTSMINQILLEMREARKWNLSILMASQLLRDFSEEIRSLLSSIFLLSNNIAKPEVIKNMFGINRHTMKFFQESCTGPDGSNGTPMVAIFKLKKKQVVQSLRFVISPYLYWITTSDRKDSDFKKYVIFRMGGASALRALAKKHPYGVRKTIEEIQDNHQDESVRNDPFKFLYENL